MNSLPMTVSILLSFYTQSKAYEDNMVGEWKQDIEIPTDTTLERSEEFLEGRNKEMFIGFMRGMLQWRPEDRKTAKDLLQDPWLNG